MEFKKNRQSVISDSFQALKPPPDIPNPRMFSDAKTAKALAKDLKNAEKRVKALKKRLQRALDDPTHSDSVYQICQRCFHKTDNITLSRDTDVKRRIKRQAFRRFLYGCPPRKKDDTSIGDASIGNGLSNVLTLASQKSTSSHVMPIMALPLKESPISMIICGKNSKNESAKEEMSSFTQNSRKR
jgi:hypothetical protein